MSLFRVRYVLAAAITVVVGGLLASCSASQNTASDTTTGTETAVTVQVATAVVGDIGSSTVYVANVAAKHQVDLAPTGTGLIEQLDVDIGDELQKGQIIAELNHGTLDAQLMQAQAMLLNAQARLATVQAEVQPNRIKAQAQVDAAQAKLEQIIAPSELDVQAAASLVDKSESDLESAQTQLRQLTNPTLSQLASAQSVVAQAESKLSQSQVATNAAISSKLSSQDAGTLWDLLLGARLDLQANLATLKNLRQTFDLTLKEADIVAAQQIIDQNRKSISNLLASIESESVIPQDINDAIWAESSAQSVLDDAQAKLSELENPNQNAVSLAQSRIDAAQATLDSATSKLNLLRNPTTSALASAAAELANAEQALALTQDRHVRYEIDAAQANVAQAQAEVQLAQQQLADRQVRAPFDGLVSRRWLSIGAVVTPQTPIITMVSQELVVSLLVEEIRIKSLKIGDLVTVTSPALPGSSIEMQIDRVSPRGDSQEHTFSVQLRPLDNAQGLQPGMSGEVSISAIHREAVLVPKEAVVYRDNQPMIFKLVNNQASLLNVEIGLSDAKSIEIMAGVLPGESVIVSGHELLNDGDKVVVKDPG